MLWGEPARPDLEALMSLMAGEFSRPPHSARAEVEGVPLLLRALRLNLDRDPRLSIEDAAGAIHTSVRTLQRSLAGLGTTFAAEAQDARIRRAEHLLLETNEPLTNIALEV